MSPLQIILLLRLYACAKPREDYPIEQRMAPAMKEAFARFLELGFLADGVSHASVMGEDNPYLERLSDKGLAMVERLCSLELEAAQQPAAAPCDWKGGDAVCQMCGGEQSACDGGAPAAAPVSGDVALPVPLEIYWPDLNRHALGCGVEDRNIRDRYEAAEYGWQDGVDKAIECVPEQIYDADQLRTYGQQCSDAALERAAKVCAAYGTTQGNYFAAAIRALKGGE